MNTLVQVHDWFSAAQYDLDSAVTLLDDFRFGHCLAMCGSCLNKIFKAFWVHRFQEHPPRTATHLYLAAKLALPLNEGQVNLLATLSLFELQPEDVCRWKALRRFINEEFAREHLAQTEKFIEWLKPMLRG